MCGIIGYIGKKKTIGELINCLKNLEYRGYDSAGYLANGLNDEVSVKRSIGRIAALEAVSDAELAASTPYFISHSRWATHGGVTEANAHPHSDCDGRVWLVHNGIIENYQELKEGLIERGHKFKSETDTETI